MNMKPDIKITNLVPDTNFKLLISGLMAIILWSGTATVIGFHLGVVIQLSNKISGVQPGTQSSKNVNGLNFRANTKLYFWITEVDEPRTN